jgi:putative membrane protein
MRESPLHRRARLPLIMAAGMLIGLAILTTLVVRSGLPAILQHLAAAGWALLWVIPARLVTLSVDASAWKTLLHDQPRITTPWLTWVAAVRDAVNNLLPVARVGGEMAAVRLMMARGVPGPITGASIIVEISLALMMQIAFTVLGVALLLYYLRDHAAALIVSLGLALSLPVVVGFILLQYRWGLFQLLERGLAALSGRNVLALVGDPGLLDRAIQDLYRRRKLILRTALWQLLTMISGAVELWFTLWLLGHPIDPAAALMLESLAQAVQSASFMVPAGIGIQEGGLVVFGAAAGLTPEVALALSFARRVRDLGVGLPTLLSWQWVEGRQLHQLLKRS